jgi:hypothetical protein
VARHIFQACPVWIYTQSNITQASYSPEYITPTQQILSLSLFAGIEASTDNISQELTYFRHCVAPFDILTGKYFLPIPEQLLIF